MQGQPGFFDLSDRYEALSAAGDPLERLGLVVDFEVFRGPLIAGAARADGTKGGRPAFDHVLMFKILLLQAMHGLSDERCEYLIKDRLSFMRFLGLGLADPVPDANTIWTFREALKRAGAVERLFARFDATLRDGRLPGDGRADRGRDHRRRAEAAQHRGREGGDQGRAGPRRLGGEAREAAPEGPRRALDGEVLQGQAARGWRAAGRSRRAGLRLQEPRRDRSPARPDPRLDRQPCRRP